MVHPQTMDRKNVVFFFFFFWSMLITLLPSSTTWLTTFQTAYGYQAPLFLTEEEEAQVLSAYALGHAVIGFKKSSSDPSQDSSEL